MNRHNLLKLFGIAALVPEVLKANEKVHVITEYNAPNEEYSYGSISDKRLMTEPLFISFDETLPTRWRI